MKNISIAGYVGNNAKAIRDDKCLSFSIAVKHYKNRDESTIWFQCFYWRNEETINKLINLIKKGSFVACSGDFFLWEKEDGEITPCVNVNHLSFCSKTETESESKMKKSFDDDDLPF